MVERSNRILQRLRASTTPQHRAELARLPMWQRASVGGLQLGIVHGDAQSLAGWGFAQEHLRDAAHRQTVQGWFDAAKVDAFACTHTCLPVFQHIGGAARPRWVLNNGAAGMPNFAGDLSGLCTRIARTPSPHPVLQEVSVGEVHVALLPLRFDAQRWQQEFLAQWPAGSAAWLSYFDRITRGPAFQPQQALCPPSP